MPIQSNLALAPNHEVKSQRQVLRPSLSLLQSDP